MLNIVPEIALKLFEAIKKAETANVKLIWEDSDVIMKFQVTHKPYQTSLMKKR